jgi:hypothetical protein
MVVMMVGAPVAMRECIFVMFLGGRGAKLCAERMNIACELIRLLVGLIGAPLRPLRCCRRRLSL